MERPTPTSLILRSRPGYILCRFPLYHRDDHVFRRTARSHRALCRNRRGDIDDRRSGYGSDVGETSGQVWEETGHDLGLFGVYHTGRHGGIQLETLAYRSMESAL